MSEYPWNEKNNTFTWLGSYYNPFNLLPVRFFSLVFVLQFDYTHPCMQPPSPTVSQKYIYCNWKCISEWSFFFNEKFLFVHKRNFNPKLSQKLFLIKLCADIFPNFAAGNIDSVLFFKWFWNVYNFLTNVIL